MVQPLSQPWRILVVDDEQSVQAVLSRLFHRMGHTMRGTLSQTEALALLGEPWDLLLIDKNLPEGSGVELAQAARVAQPEAIIILMTGFASRDSAETLIGVVDEYITKPFDLTYLGEIVTALMDFREVGRRAKTAAAPGPPPPAEPSAPLQSRPSPLPRSTSTPLTPLPALPPARARAVSRGSGLLTVHIVLSDAREESLFLGEARKAGLSASSGPLAETMFPEVLIVDGKSATLELRKAVWLRQARTPALRVAMVVESSSLADSTAAVALKAAHRLLRPLFSGAVAQLLARLKT